MRSAKWGQIGRRRRADRARTAPARWCSSARSDRRPDFSSMAVDFGTLRYLPRLIRGHARRRRHLLAQLRASSRRSAATGSSARMRWRRTWSRKPGRSAGTGAERRRRSPTLGWRWRRRERSALIDAGQAAVGGQRARRRAGGGGRHRRHARAGRKLCGQTGGSRGPGRAGVLAKCVQAAAGSPRRHADDRPADGRSRGARRAGRDRHRGRAGDDRRARARPWRSPTGPACSSSPSTAGRARHERRRYGRRRAASPSSSSPARRSGDLLGAGLMER